METAACTHALALVIRSRSIDAGPAIADAEVLVTDAPALSRNFHHLVSDESTLRWVQLTYAGVDQAMIALSSLGKV